MNRKTNIPPEDLQWILENPLPDSPGLFSKSPIWFKHSAYDIKEVKGNLYICPVSGSTLTHYKPFEKFPQIMVDFIELLVKLNKVNDKQEREYNRGLSKNITEGEQIKSLGKAEMERAKLLLEFISQYGPLGIIYEYIEGLYPCRKDGNDNFDKLIVALDTKAYSGLSYSLQKKIMPSYTKEGIFNFIPIIKYDDLCSYFLLNDREPYPEIRSKEFKEYYSEKINDIILNRNIGLLTWHIRKINEYFTKNYTPADKVPDINNTKWSQYLRYSFGDIGLTFCFDNETNKWDLNWNFKSLIGALSIMYLMNLTGKMGSEVHICKYSGCNRIVIDRNCCVQHDDAYRKAKSRENQKRNIIEEYKSGKSVEELSDKYKISITRINKWLGESEILKKPQE